MPTIFDRRTPYPTHSYITQEGDRGPTANCSHCSEMGAGETKDQVQPQKEELPEEPSGTAGQSKQQRKGHAGEVAKQFYTD